jgi:hypothetical protein
MSMYTDDMIGVCLRRDIEVDLATTRSLCIRLLGDNAVEDEKTEWGRRLTVIGWDIDLDNSLVTVSRRNALKAFYGFAAINLDRPVPMPVIERWASWAERYSTVCVYMKPFRRVLYSRVRHLLQNITVKLDNDVRQAVRLYAALTALIVVREGSFSRSLQSFARTPESVVLEFDGSLEGVGVIWYSVIYDETGRHEVPLGGSAADLRGLCFGSDTQFQNCAEFIAVVMGILGLMVLEIDVKAVLLRGDSETALSWASGGNFRSFNVMNAAAVFAYLCAATGFRVVERVRISSEVNWRCDQLSRRSVGESWMETERKLARRDGRMKGLRKVEVNMQEVLQLCDPKAQWASETEFGVFWRRAMNLLSSVV